MARPQPKTLVIIGAGPAGLTAAIEAQKTGMEVTVLEQDRDYVGGIARTVRHGGHRFDVGGHRFFSKSGRVNEWWKQHLPGDFIQVRRMSRIFYRGRYFDYPLKAWNALRNLGVGMSIVCVASYVWARLFPRKPEQSFEDWVSNRFGRRLFSIFFKTYTEKVWGMPTSQLSADWAAQRIKGLSLASAIINAFKGPASGGKGKVIKTLIDTFDYPRLGPGQMWEKAAQDLQAKGGTLRMGEKVVKIHHAGGRVTAVETQTAGGERRRHEADAFIVSMPLKETVLALEPPPPAETLAAARGLGYRDFLTVALMLEGANPFPDNWIYIHDPSVKLGRIQNFRNWSEALVAPGSTTCLGLEYFCFEGDALWTRSDAELIELGTQELEALGLAKRGVIQGGVVVRMAKAYPVYDEHYRQRVTTIKQALETYATNLQVVGRNGMHKYNNMDHSMMTAFLAVENLKGGRYNLWNVNSDAEYHEEKAGDGSEDAIVRKPA